MIQTHIHVDTQGERTGANVSENASEYETETSSGGR